MTVGRRQWLWILDIMWMQAGRSLVASKDESGTRSTAYRCGCIGAGVAATLRSQTIQVRGVNLFHAVSRGVRRHIICDDPHKVWGIGGVQQGLRHQEHGCKECESAYHLIHVEGLLGKLIHV